MLRLEIESPSRRGEVSRRWECLKRQYGSGVIRRRTSLSEEGEDIGFGGADVEEGYLAIEGRKADEIRLGGG